MTLHPSTAPQRVPLPSPPVSSLPDGPDPESDSLRAASPAVTRFLATTVTDPLFESTAASVLVAELVDFAAACRLDYATSLVSESASASVCPLSVGGECALGTDVLEDRQEEFESFAAVVPHLVSMLLAPEGDPDALDIPTLRSYAEAMEGPYSSQWQAAMDAEMASWESTGTYVDEVPPPGANIVSVMWIFRVKRPPGSPPVFKARYVAGGFSQRQGVDDYRRYTTVFPLCSKGKVRDVLIPWIRAVRLQLRKRFRQDLPFLRLLFDRGGEFSSVGLLSWGGHSPVGPTPLGVSQVDSLPSTAPIEVAAKPGAARGAACGGAASGVAEPRGAEFEGAGSGGAEPGCADPGGAEPEGVEPRGAKSRGIASSGGPADASPQLSPLPEPVSPQQLREWFAQHTRLQSGAAGARDSAARDTKDGGVGATSLGGARVTAGAGGTGGAAAAGPGGARTRGTGAAGAGSVGGGGAGGAEAGDTAEP
ncbi:unnamed protein product [Closterium sp. NIES-54]